MNFSWKKFLQVCAGAMLGLAVLFVLLQNTATASTNISSAVTEHWGWNDLGGWIDFYMGGASDVTVDSAHLMGYASSSIGYISFDCSTAPGGDKCGVGGSTAYKVYNDGLGGLSGFAWNDLYGWISFCGGGGTADCPGATRYQTVIDRTSGIFQGTSESFAWNDILGWISFNCANAGGGAGCSTFRVITSWRAISATGTIDSATFDTGVAGGAQLNSVLWRGTMPAGTLVGFQFATSNASSGPWNFVGSSGSGDTYYYPFAPGVSLPLDYTFHDNQRYFRYRATLFTDAAKHVSPSVTDIIVNWSP